MWLRRAYLHAVPRAAFFPLQTHAPAGPLLVLAPTTVLHNSAMPISHVVCHPHPPLPHPGPRRQFVFVLQDAMSAFERCPVPVVAAVHGHCVGAGLDLITACDLRLASEDAQFAVKVSRGPGVGALKKLLALHPRAFSACSAPPGGTGLVHLCANVLGWKRGMWGRMGRCLMWHGV